MERDLIYKQHLNSESNFFYYGLINLDTMSLNAEKVKKFTEKISTEKVSKRVFHLFIEIVENIRRYSKFRTKSDGEGGFSVNFVGNTIVFESINFTNDSVKLLEKINFVNKLNEEELKMEYTKRLKRKREIGETGAGLGLYSMKIKSGSDIKINLHNYDEIGKLAIITLKYKIR
ncbi:MAG: hypothetical protein JXR48_14365 [Candidatus Delongbacteria bacterium]|nr:hypothetical protein [Candidatus Delongbacteria bacterium]MBN2836139.1 hypothetical protein [Candidatus Delongbacteria bacterium]